ncbi:MAG: hypothetical protein WAU45_11475 [Blastocatellia bacterium]
MMRMRASLLLLFSVLGLGFAASCSQLHSVPPRNTSAAGDSQNSSTPARSDATSVGFTSRTKLVEHYDKHGREFDSVTIHQYLRMAQELRDRPADDTVIEAVRGDGVVTRFDRKSGAFLAFNPDRTIRTFFKPNDGEAYFRRQLKRGD